MAAATDASDKVFSDLDFSKVREHSLDIFQILTARYSNHSAEGVDAPSMLCTAAALTGETIRRACSNLATPEDRAAAHGYIFATANHLRGRKDGIEKDPKNFPRVETTLRHARYNPATISGGPVFSSGSEPNELPQYGAAALREDVFHIFKTGKLTREEGVIACIGALFETSNALSKTIPSSVAYKMSMEVIVGMIDLAEPLERNYAPIGNNMFVSRRIVDAGKEITSVLVKQDVVLSQGPRHPSTLVAKAGVLLGEAVYNADRSGKAEEYRTFISAGADKYLKKCNHILVEAFSENAEDGKKFPLYEDYARHASLKSGKDAYPKHNVKKEEMPRAFPPDEAAMAREAVAFIAIRYMLSDWERATAALWCVKNVIEDTKGELPVMTAVKIAMEEAATWARRKPVDLDDLMRQTPEARARVCELRELTRAAVVCKLA